MKRLNFNNKLRLFIAIFVILFSLKGSAQVVMPDQIKPGDTWGLIDVNNLYGGFMQVADYNALLTIDVQFVKKGMVVIVYDYDGIEANGIETRSFMFVPAAGTWNYSSPFDIPAAQQNNVVNAADWKEVSIRPVAGVNRIDTVSIKALIFDGDTLRGFSTDPNFTNATDSLFPTQLAVALFVDSLFTDLRAYGMFDTIDVDTAWVNSLGIKYFTLNGRYITSISNDSLLSGADSLKLITEYSVQTRIDSVLEYVDGQFSALSQNMIEDTQDGETMIKVTDGDSVIFRIANDTTIVIDPNKNITISDATVVLNGDSIYEVADEGEAFASAGDSAKAVTSLSTVDSMIADGANDIKFAFGTKKVTRAGWPGVSGNTVSADNLEQFLQKLFFPMPAPLINSFGTPAQSTQTVDVNGNIIPSVGTINIPYATWKADAGITFSFNVDNRTDAASDPADELPAQAITSVKVTKGASDVGSYTITDGTTDQSGTIAVNAADVNVNATSASSNVFTLVVEDEYPNTNTLDVNVNMSAATRLTIDYTRVLSAASNSVLALQREGQDKTFNFYWRVNTQDDTISALKFSDVAEPTITLPSPAYGGLKTGTETITLPYNISQKTLTLEAQSSIYNNWVTRTSARAYWFYKCYYGYIPVTGSGDANTKIQYTVDNVTQAALTSGGGTSTSNFESNYFTKTGTGSSNGFQVGFSGQSGEFLAYVLIPKKNNLADVAGGSYILSLMNPAGIFEAQNAITDFKEIVFDYGTVTEAYYIVYLKQIYENPASDIYIRF